MVWRRRGLVGVSVASQTSAERGGGTLVTMVLVTMDPFPRHRWIKESNVTVSVMRKEHKYCNYATVLQCLWWQKMVCVVCTTICMCSSDPLLHIFSCSHLNTFREHVSIMDDKCTYLTLCNLIGVASILVTSTKTCPRLCSFQTQRRSLQYAPYSQLWLESQPVSVKKKHPETFDCDHSAKVAVTLRPWQNLPWPHDLFVECGEIP